MGNNDEYDSMTSSRWRHPARAHAGGSPWGKLSEDNLAASIRDERLSRGWSQETLARLVSEAGARLHQSSIAKIEKTEGRRRPITVDEALAFSRVFEVPLYDMLVSPEARRSERIRKLESQIVDVAERAALALEERDFLQRQLEEQRAALDEGTAAENVDDIVFVDLTDEDDKEASRG